MVGDGGEVTNKFSELHEKLGKCHLNTYIWSLPLIALNVIGIVVIFYLRDIHQIQCLHEKYCYELNQTVPRRGFPLSGNCPWYLDIPPDCCVAFCYRYNALYDIKGSTQEDCYYDEQLANNIQFHTPLDLTCSCTELCIEKDYKGTVYIRTVSTFSLFMFHSSHILVFGILVTLVA